MCLRAAVQVEAPLPTPGTSESDAEPGRPMIGSSKSRAHRNGEPSLERHSRTSQHALSDEMSDKRAFFFALRYLGFVTSFQPAAASNWVQVSE